MSKYIAEGTQPPFEIEICVAKSPGKYGYQTIYCRQAIENSTDMTRVSDYVPVTFHPRSIKEIVPEMVKKIDEEIRQSRIQHAETISKLESQKKDLLSLEYDKDSNFEDDIPF